MSGIGFVTSLHYPADTLTPIPFRLELETALDFLVGFCCPSSLSRLATTHEDTQFSVFSQFFFFSHAAGLGKYVSLLL
jgi:hypothetical protein